MNLNSKRISFIKKLAHVYLLNVLIFCLIYTSIPTIPAYAANIFSLDLGTIPNIEKLVIYPDRLEARSASTNRDPSPEDYEEGVVLYTKNTAEFDVLELIGTKSVNIFVVGSGGDSGRNPDLASNCTIRLNNFNTDSNLYLGEFRKANNGNYNINVELIGSNRINNMYLGASGGTVTVSGSGSLTASEVSLNNYRKYGLNNGFLHWEYWTGENKTATLIVNNSTLNVNENLLCTQRAVSPDSLGGDPRYYIGATEPATLIQNNGNITAKKVLCGSNESGNRYTANGGSFIQNNGYLKCLELSNGGIGNNSYYAGISGESNSGGKGGTVTVSGNGVLVMNNGTVANGGVGYTFPSGNAISKEIPAHNGSIITTKSYFSGSTNAQIVDSYGRPISKVVLNLDSSVANKLVNVTIDDDTINSYTDEQGRYICYLPVSKENSKASINVDGQIYRGIFKPTINELTNTFTLSKGDINIDNSFKPIILEQSDHTEQYIGQTMSLFVNAKSAITNNAVNLRYEWEKQNADYSFSTIPDSNTSNLKQNVTENSAGIYRCKVIDKDGSFSYTNNITVTIGKKPPVIIDQAQNSNTYFGENLTLFVNAKSAITNNAVNLRYEWEKQNVDGSFSTISNSNNAVYQQQNITESNAGTYRCKVIDKDGSFSYSLNITVTVIKRPPIIINQSHDISCYVGETLALNVDAKSMITGNNVGLTFSWEKQNVDGTFSVIPNSNDAVYQQQNITENNAGIYKCRIAEKDGSFIYTNNINVEVKKREQVIFTAKETYVKKYGATEFSLADDIAVLGNAPISYNLVSGNEVIDENVLVDNGTISIKKTGVATVRVTTEETMKYKESSKDITIAVNKANVPVAMSSDIKVTYGDDYNINVSVENGISYKLEYKPLNGGIYTTDKPVNVGNYLVRVTTTNSNFETATLVSALEISKRNLYFTDLKVKEKKYDGNTNAEVQNYKIVNAAPKDEKKISLSFNPKYEHKNVGNNIRVSLNTKLNGDEELLKNYEYTLPTFSAGVILTTELKITLDNFTREVGVQNPKFTYKINGFVAGETKTNTNFIEPSISTNAEEKEGSYEIIASGASADNYYITYVKGNIEVIKADETGIIARVPDKTYDGKQIDIVVTNSPTSQIELEYYNMDENKIIGTVLKEVATSGSATKINIRNTDKITPFEAGNYKVKISSMNDGIHNVVQKEYFFTIEKAVLTISTKEMTVELGQALPKFEYMISGFQNGENENIQGFVLPTVFHDVTELSECGSYTVKLEKGNPTDNYIFKYVNSKIKIIPPAGMKEVKVITPFIDSDISFMITKNKSLNVYKSNEFGVFKVIIPDTDNSIEIRKENLKFVGNIPKEKLTIHTNDLRLVLDLSKGDITISGDGNGNTIINQSPEKNFIHNGDITIDETVESDNNIIIDKDNVDESKIDNKTEKPLVSGLKEVSVITPFINSSVSMTINKKTKVYQSDEFGNFKVIIPTEDTYVELCNNNIKFVGDIPKESLVVNTNNLTLVLELSKGDITISGDENNNIVVNQSPIKDFIHNGNIIIDETKENNNNINMDKDTVDVDKITNNTNKPYVSMTKKVKVITPFTDSEIIVKVNTTAKVYQSNKEGSFQITTPNKKNNIEITNGVIKFVGEVPKESLIIHTNELRLILDLNKGDITIVGDGNDNTMISQPPEKDFNHNGNITIIQPESNGNNTGNGNIMLDKNTVDEDKITNETGKPFLSMTKEVRVITPFSNSKITMVVNGKSEVYQSDQTGVFIAIILNKDNDIEIWKENIKFVGKVSKDSVVIDTNDLKLILNLSKGDITISGDSNGNTLIKQTPEENFIHNGDVTIIETENSNHTITIDKNKVNEDKITNETSKPVKDSSSSSSSNGGSSSSGSGSSNNNGSETDIPNKPENKPEHKPEEDKNSNSEETNTENSNNSNSKYYLPTLSIKCNHPNIKINSAKVTYTNKDLLFHVQVKKGSSKIKYIAYKFLPIGKSSAKVKWNYMKKTSFALKQTKNFKGKLIVKVMDKAGSSRLKEIKFTLDKQKPTIFGIKAKGTYHTKRVISFKDNLSGIKMATLNGKTIRNKYTVSKSGKYKLRVMDNSNNSSVINFTIKRKLDTKQPVSKKPIEKVSNKKGGKK